MKGEDFKLICVKDSKSNTYCVWAASMPGLIVQVDKLEDAPKELATSYECVLRYGFKTGVHEIVNLDDSPLT